jgi:hypothetical protein
MDDVEVIQECAKRNATGLSLLDGGRWIDTLVKRNNPNIDTLYDFPKLGLGKEKLKNTELGMVYFPMSVGHLTPKHVVTVHDLKEVRNRKADVYGILSRNSYPNLDQYPEVIKSVSRFEGINSVGELDHFPESLFECCRYTSVHGVPAATSTTKASNR